MSQHTKLAQIIISLLPAANVSVLEFLEITDDATGLVTSSHPLPARDVLPGDADAAAINPALAAQQATIADLTARLAAAKTDAQTAATKAASDLLAAQSATKAAQDDATAKAAQVQQMQAQLVALRTPVASAQNAAQQAAASVFNALPLGKQVLWEQVRIAVDTALAVDDLARAERIIVTVPEIYEGMEADRQAFLALFGASPKT